MRWAFLSVICVSLVCAQPRRDRDQEFKNPLNGQPEAIDAGRKLFAGACGVCHGPNGEGGRGPNLTTGRETRRLDDRGLFESIRKGVPGTDMPPSNLPEDKLWQLVAFVRALSAPAFESRVPGDAEAGGALFFGKAGCSECHAILGRGGRLGPDLSNAGMSRQAAYLEEALMNPGARFPEGYRAGAVVLHDGRRIEGIIREKTNYLVAVLDKGGEIRRFDMKEVSDVTFRKSSLMPDDYAKRLSKDEIQNVLAFLSRQSLRTERPMERGR